MGNARLGMIPQIGGSYKNQNDTCPFCNKQEALARDGQTIKHIFYECTSSIIKNLIREFKFENFSLHNLWNSPILSAKFIEQVITRKPQFSSDEQQQLIQNGR